MILSPLYFKVYSLVEGYWDLWVVRGAAVPAFRFFFFRLSGLDCSVFSGVVAWLVLEAVGDAKAQE